MRAQIKCIKVYNLHNLFINMTKNENDGVFFIQNTRHCYYLLHNVRHNICTLCFLSYSPISLTWSQYLWKYGCLNVKVEIAKIRHTATRNTPRSVQKSMGFNHPYTNMIFRYPIHYEIISRVKMRYRSTWYVGYWFS